jgi:alpha-1,2-rhamnosyltransferase
MHSIGHQIPPGTRRLFIECTATAALDVNTGVQRVVRNIVNRTSGVGSEFGLSCQGVVFRPGSGFQPIERLKYPDSPQSPWGEARQALRGRFRARIKHWLEAAKLLDAARALKNRAYRATYLALRPLRRRSGTLLDWREGDVLLLADVWWGPNFPWHEVREAQAAGAKVGLVVYDLIPLRFPEVSGPIQSLFSRTWNKARTTADFVIGISRSVLDDVDAVDRQRRPAGAPRATLHSASFRLGAELDGARSAGVVGQAVQQAFGDELDDSIVASLAGPTFERAEQDRKPGSEQCRICRKSYLLVGMISPRKNHALALDAFERLWAAGSDARLVIVGKYGWDANDLIERIHRHPQFGRKLHWLPDVRDDELDWCYRHAACLITTSIAEGFNLPIIEALSKGCPVLASDLPVHREVGGQFTAYFPVGDAAALAETIDAQQCTGLLPGIRPVDQFRWPDWTESCRELLGEILKLAPDRQPAHVHTRRSRSAA